LRFYPEDTGSRFLYKTTWHHNPEDCNIYYEIHSLAVQQCGIINSRVWGNKSFTFPPSDCFMWSNHHWKCTDTLFLTLYRHPQTKSPVLYFATFESKALCKNEWHELTNGFEMRSTLLHGPYETHYVQSVFQFM